MERFVPSRLLDHSARAQVNEGIASHMVWPDVFMEVGWKTIHGRHNWNFKASKTDFEL